MKTQNEFSTWVEYKAYMNGYIDGQKKGHENMDEIFKEILGDKQ